MIFSYLHCLLIWPKQAARRQRQLLLTVDLGSCQYFHYWKTIQEIVHHWLTQCIFGRCLLHRPVLCQNSHKELKTKPYEKIIQFYSTSSIRLIEKQRQTHYLAKLYGRPAWTSLSQTGGHGRHTQALCSLEVADGMSSRLLEGIFLSALLFKAIKTGFNSSSEPVTRQNTWTLHTQTCHFKQVTKKTTMDFSGESILTVSKDSKRSMNIQKKSKRNKVNV